MKKIVPIVVVILIYLLSFSQFVKMYTADYYYRKSQLLISKKTTNEALTFATKAIEKNPLEPRYYWGRAKVLLTVTASEKEESKETYKDLAINDMETAYYLNENNLVTIRNLIPLYYFLAIDDVSKSAEVNNIDENYVEITKEYYEKVKNVSPNDAGVYTLLAKYEKRLGWEEKYKESINKIEGLRPDLLEWHPNFNILTIQ